MFKKTAFACSLSLLLIVPSVLAAVEWHHPLSLDGGGWWRGRLKVTVANPMQRAAAGDPVALKIGKATGEADLVGQHAESIRVCNAQGEEMVFAILEPQGKTLVRGPIPAGGKLILPVECEANQSATYYVYFDNPAAGELPDWLDNIQPERLEQAGLTAVAEPLEQANILEKGRDDPWNTETSLDALPGSKALWNHRLAVRSFNFSPEKTSALATVNTTRFDMQTPTGKAKYLVVSDGEKTIPAQRLGNALFWNAETPAHSAHTWHVFWCSDPKLLAENLDADGMAVEVSPGQLRGNRVKNPEFASGDPLPDAWTHDAAAPESGIEFGVEDLDNPIVGKRCVRMHVPHGTPSQWRGWHQTVPVESGKRYFVSVWIKSKDCTDSELRAYVHRLAADGGPSREGLSVALEPGLPSNSDWTFVSGTLDVPNDTVALGLHLTMQGAGTIWHGGAAVVEASPARLGRCEGSPLASDDVKLWTVPAVVKVFEDNASPSLSEPIRVTAARNEREPIQLAVRSGRAVSGVRVEVEPPALPDGSKLSDFEVRLIGYVPIDYPTFYYRSNTPAWHRKTPNEPPGCDGWAGRWPDPMLPDRPFDLAPNATQPIWITFNVPADAPAGEYKGKVRLVADGKTLCQQPFSIRVWDFALPEQSHVAAKYDLGPGPGGHWWGKSWDEMRPKILALLAKNRLCADGIHPTPQFHYKDGQATADFTEFDRAAAHYFDELKMPYAWTPWDFYLFGWGLPPWVKFGEHPYPGEPPYEGADRAQLRPEFKRAYQTCLKLFWDHLKEKGWDKKFVLYLCDEPFYTKPQIVEQFKTLCRMIHEVDPAIPIYASTWLHVPDWDDSLDIWGIAHYGAVPVEQIEKLRAAGKRIWWTTDGQMCTDTPYCAVERLLPHYCFKYGAEAYEFWGAAWLTYDPNRFGWHAYIPQSDEPGVSYWVRYPNGDGYLTYPGHSLGIDGPLSTIRLEQAREGVEDYEYLYQLRELTSKAKAAGKDVSAAEQALARADRLVAIPNAGGRFSSKILPDPAEVYRVKQQVAEAIESLLAGTVGTEPE